MNTIQLEIEEQLRYFNELKNISINEQGENKDDFESGYACGQEAAYDEAISSLEGLVEVVTGIYPESESRDIQE